MARFIVDIPEDVLEDYNSNLDVMDEIAEALQDQFGAEKVEVKETF